MANRKPIFAQKTSYAVAAFVVALILMLAFCEDSNGAWALEEQHDSNAGITEKNAGYDRICVRKFFETQTSTYICPLLAVGGKTHGDSFEIGVTDRLFNRWEGEIKLGRFDGFMNGGGTVRRIVGDGPFQLGLGMTYWVNQSPGSNSDLTFNLSLRYTFGAP